MTNALPNQPPTEPTSPKVSSQRPTPNLHYHEDSFTPCTDPYHSKQLPQQPPPLPPPQYSSVVAQSIHAAAGLLTSVSRDTLTIVLLSTMLIGGGYLLYLQVKALEANTLAVERNTSASNEVRNFIQAVIEDLKEHKKTH